MAESASSLATSGVIEHAAAPLVVEGASKVFGGLQALDNINMSISRGERRALIGANGAGKTTLFHLISGVLKPSSGKIWLFGKDATRMPIHRRAGLGVARTFQITNLLPTLSVLENILLSLQVQQTGGFAIRRSIHSFDEHLFSQARHIMEGWNLWDQRDTEVRNLSYGEQRELEIIMALAQKPRLLLLDEPTSGLSPTETASVAKMIHELPQDVTVLLIEHDMDVTFDLVDRITVLHLGRIVAEGTPDEIRRNQTVQQIYLGSQAL